jgi:uncharacterized protein (UPF0335 family)
MYDDASKTTRECKSLEAQREEIDRRLDDFVDNLNVEGFDSKVITEALVALVREIEAAEKRIPALRA